MDGREVDADTLDFTIGWLALVLVFPCSFIFFGVLKGIRGSGYKQDEEGKRVESGEGMVKLVDRLPLHTRRHAGTDYMAPTIMLGQRGQERGVGREWNKRGRVLRGIFFLLLLLLLWIG